MDSIFNYLGAERMALSIALIVLTALVLGFAIGLIGKAKVRASKGFFVTACLIPPIVASVIGIMTAFITSSTVSDITRIATIAVALGLIRFRSNNAKGEELLILFLGIAIGLACGLGYLAIAGILAVVLLAVFFILCSVHIFDANKGRQESLLKITIPENLEYDELFSETFSHYLKENELVEVKTTAMGSLFRLSYRIVFSDKSKQKEFIDELRTKNGNLEISITPFVYEAKDL